MLSHFNKFTNKKKNEFETGENINRIYFNETYSLLN